MDSSQPEQVIVDPNAMAKASGSPYFQLGGWMVRLCVESFCHQHDPDAVHCAAEQSMWPACTHVPLSLERHEARKTGSCAMSCAQLGLSLLNNENQHNLPTSDPSLHLCSTLTARSTLSC